MRMKQIKNPWERTVLLRFFEVSKTTPMVQANVKIIQELKEFLHAVTRHAVNRAFFTESPTDFCRKRDLPMATVIAL